MSEHLDKNRTELFLSRRLKPDELLEATRHLAVCDACQSNLKSARDISTSTAFIARDLQKTFQPKQTHLNYEELEAFVNETLKQSEKEKVKKHLSLCTVCDTDAKELILMRDNLSIYPNAAVAIQPIQENESFFKKIFGSFGVLSFQTLGLAAALLFVMLLVSFLFWRSAKPPEMANGNNKNQPEFANTNNPTNSNEKKEEQAQTNTNQEPQNKNVPEKKPEIAKKEDKEEPKKTNDYSELDNVVAESIQKQSVNTPSSLNDLNSRESTLMGSNDGAEKFILFTPQGTVVQSVRPTFRWQSLEGAEGYTVYLLDTNFNLLQKSELIKVENWTATKPLKRGQTYIWQVIANKDGKEITSPVAPAKEARFKVLEGKKNNELQGYLKTKKNNHLALGIVFAHKGLLDEAERELKLAINAGQQFSLAQKLLSEIKEIRK